MHLTQHPMSRALAAGALAVSLVAGGTAGAFAADAASSPGVGAKPTPSPSKSTAASITIKANTTSVNAGGSVTFTGRTSGLKVGWPLVLQHQKAGKWIPLKATSKIKNGSSYSLTAKLNTVGTEHLRISAVGKKVYSPAVTVKVS
ncbi:hypothetical protein AB0N16_13225 [Streptomyces sp. NPDC051105]|uniref:hypothetical protein n=1 Tax=Streptomyces sp. NPDC051105 TaxID=3154843 RepID=UPI0034470E85